MILVAFGVLAAPAQAWWTDHPLRDAAAELAGRDVGVRCMADAEANRENIWGEALVENSGYMIAREWVCHATLDFLNGAGVDEVAEAEAFMVFIHESAHLRGWRNEAKAQRWALRNYRKAALRYGASYEQAAQMLEYAIGFHLRLPSDYRTRGCVRPSQDSIGHLQNCR